MTVPDRIWISLSAPEYTTLDPNDPEWTLMGYYDEFYIRKGAFPVEEVERIRELLITAIGLGDATRTAGLHQGRAAQSVEALGRILSLLEGANGGMGDE